MAHYVAKLPVRAKHRRVLGRLWCRYTCGTCGSRSWWHRPYGASLWIARHRGASPTCYETKENY